MTSKAKVVRLTGVDTWVADLKRQFIDDGVHRCPTFTAEQRKGQWGVYVQYLWEDPKFNETRTGEWFVTYSGVPDEAGVREAVARLDAFT